MTTNPHIVQPNKHHYNLKGIMCAVYEKNFYYPFKIYRFGFVAHLPYSDHRWVEIHCAPSIFFFQLAISTSWEKDWVREERELNAIEDYLDEHQQTKEKENK